jgi:hypothetical protein
MNTQRLPDRPIGAVLAAEIAATVGIAEKEIEHLARAGVIFGQRLSDGRVYVSRDVIDVLPEIMIHRSSSGGPRGGHNRAHNAPGNGRGIMNPNSKHSGGRPFHAGQEGG